MLSLDPDQYAAATTTAEHALVVAAAGSGKTRTLHARVEHLLEGGAYPGALFVCTFTRKAAGELQERIANPRLREVGTFHSLLWRHVVKPYASLVGLEKPVIVDEDGALAVLRRVVAQHGRDHPEVRFPEGRKELRQLQQAISARENGAKWHRYLDSNPGSDFDNLVQRYHADLLAHNFVDFDGILSYSVAILVHEGPRREVATGFSHVLVDEYQDTNGLQVEIVKALASEGANVFCVGDADQSIYGFRGADPYNLSKLRRAFPDLMVYHLPLTYRCPPAVVDAARSVIGMNVEAFPGARAELVAAEDKDGFLRVLPCNGLVGEMHQTVGYLKALLDVRTRPGDIAVLVRSRRALYMKEGRGAAFPALLRQARVPFVLVGARDLFEYAEVADLVGFAETCIDPVRYEHNFPRLLKRFSGVLKLGIGDKALDDMEKEKARTGRPFMDLLPAYGTKEGGARFAAIIAEGHQRVSGSPYEFLVWAQEALRHDVLLARDEGGEHVEELLALARTAQTEGASFEEMLGELRIDAELPDDEGGRVTVSTVHAAKGLEWPHVVVLGCDEGIWPDFRNRDGEELKEERRSLYVAITRAKDSVVIFCSEGSESSLLRPLLREVVAA